MFLARSMKSMRRAPFNVTTIKLHINYSYFFIVSLVLVFYVENIFINSISLKQGRRIVSDFYLLNLHDIHHTVPPAPRLRSVLMTSRCIRIFPVRLRLMYQIDSTVGEVYFFLYNWQKLRFRLCL